MTYKIISLKDRLKPEFNQKFESANLKYPKLTGSILDALENESLITELKYATIMDITFLLGVQNPFAMFKDL
tara:strand:- start:27 stop:242 length:216 start_codon:yes stop_codon:yes gene_type:complete